MAQPDPSTVDARPSPAESEDRLFGTGGLVGAVVLLNVLLGSFGVLKLLPAQVPTVIDVGLVCGILSVGLRGARTKVVVVAMGLLALSGLLLAEQESTAVIGAGGLALTVVLLPAAVHLVRTRHGRPDPLRLLGAVLSGALLAATALGVIAIGIQRSGAFALRYGTQVVVALPNRCQTDITTDYRAGTATQETSCSDATWQENGVTTRGLLHLDGSELGPATSGPLFSYTATEVTAYAVGDQAYTAKVVTSRNWFVQLGLLSGWLALAGPIYLVVLLRMHLLYRRSPPPPA